MNKLNEIKKDFDILCANDYCYLDTGATSQHPKCVIEAEANYYRKQNANPHRGSYSLSVTATNLFNEARTKIAKFINAKFDEEIIFTKNATESLNLFAYSYALNNLKTDDEVVVSIMEHHSVIVPLQMACEKTGAKLKYIYLNNNFELDKKDIDKAITKKTKIVAISSVSNVLGTINDVEYFAKKAHEVNAVLLVDISQSVAHMPFDVQKTDADFVAFSGHKMFGPMGTGVLYGKKELLEKMPPFLMGGDMIEYVYEQKTTYAPLPNKFEAGTQNAGGIIALGVAVDYINSIGFKKIKKIEKELLSFALKELKKLKFIEIYCTNNLEHHSGVISFNVKGIHAHDVASVLDSHNVFIRSGNHCAQPLLRYLGLESTCRVSLSIYNTKEDILKLIKALKHVYEIFKKYIKD